jgi:3-dehydroquinate synthase II
VPPVATIVRPPRDARKPTCMPRNASPHACRKPACVPCSGSVRMRFVYTEQARGTDAGGGSLYYGAAWEQCELHVGSTPVGARGGRPRSGHCDHWGAVGVLAAQWCACDHCGALVHALPRCVLRATCERRGQRARACADSARVSSVQVRELARAVEVRAGGARAVRLEAATVTRVTPVGMGDRVCVDLCARMSPGEGLLVGNFCRALFLVHSEVRAACSRTAPRARMRRMGRARIDTAHACSVRRARTSTAGRSA